jgi:hypothetical protein
MFQADVRGEEDLPTPGRLGEPYLILPAGQTPFPFLRPAVQGGVRARHLGLRLCGRYDLLHPLAPHLGRGGYEGGPNLYEYGRSAPCWAGDIEDRIAEAVQEQVKSVGR